MAHKEPRIYIRLSSIGHGLIEQAGPNSIYNPHRWRVGFHPNVRTPSRVGVFLFIAAGDRVRSAVPRRSSLSYLRPTRRRSAYTRFSSSPSVCSIYIAAFHTLVPPMFDMNRAHITWSPFDTFCRLYTISTRTVGCVQYLRTSGRNTGLTTNV